MAIDETTRKRWEREDKKIKIRKINIPVFLKYLTYLFLFAISAWLVYLFITLIKKI